MAKWLEMAEDQYKCLRGPEARTGQCRPWIGSGISIGGCSQSAHGLRGGTSIEQRRVKPLTPCRP